ncbi:MAG: IS200/IS605 family element transposase accessory protein TnpB [Gemmatimonadetes bacterium]|nr:IS200/IS605 family element transposase accessory protein TnpB [Gemmatimonadota bacterium]
MLKNVQIIYDTHTRDFQARLVVEVDVSDKSGEATVGVDIGEDWLIAADFCDGSQYLVCGRMLKSTRRYWQKVRAKVKPPSQDRPKMSRRYRQIARKEARQITHALHIASRRFVDAYADKGVGTIILGDLTGIRSSIAYGKRMNQRLHAWPYARLSAMIEYKAALLGIKVKVVSEKYTSQTCPQCNIRKKSNRKHRGWYSCHCGFEGQADLVGAFNIHRQVSGVSSSGRSARPVVLVYDHHTVHEVASSRKAA